MSSKGKVQRIDEDFDMELEDIKIERIKRGIEKEMISNVRITNALVRHPSWKKIKEDIIQAKPKKKK